MTDKREPSGLTRRIGDSLIVVFTMGLAALFTFGVITAVRWLVSFW